RTGGLARADVFADGAVPDRRQDGRHDADRVQPDGPGARVLWGIPPGRAALVDVSEELADAVGPDWNAGRLGPGELRTGLAHASALRDCRRPVRPHRRRDGGRLPSIAWDVDVRSSGLEPAGSSRVGRRRACRATGPRP